MAEIVLKNAAVIVNSVNLSDHVRGVTINYSAELQDKTAMGSSARKRIAGLKDFTISVDYNQDYAASKVDATHFSLVGGTTFAIKIFPNSTTVGAGNPYYSGACLLESYSPIAGSVGELNTVTINYQGNGVLSRSTA